MEGTSDAASFVTASVTPKRTVATNTAVGDSGQAAKPALSITTPPNNEHDAQMNRERMQYTKHWLRGKNEPYANVKPDLLNFSPGAACPDDDQVSLGSGSIEISSITAKANVRNSAAPDILQPLASKPYVLPFSHLPHALLNFKIE